MDHVANQYPPKLVQIGSVGKLSADLRRERSKTEHGSVEVKDVWVTELPLATHLLGPDF